MRRDFQAFVRDPRFREGYVRELWFEYLTPRTQQHLLSTADSDINVLLAMRPGRDELALRLMQEGECP